MPKRLNPFLESSLYNSDSTLFKVAPVKKASYFKKKKAVQDKAHFQIILNSKKEHECFSCFQPVIKSSRYLRLYAAIAGNWPRSVAFHNPECFESWLGKQWYFKEPASAEALHSQYAVFKFYFPKNKKQYVPIEGKVLKWLILDGYELLPKWVPPSEGPPQKCACEAFEVKNEPKEIGNDLIPNFKHNKKICEGTCKCGAYFISTFPSKPTHKTLVNHISNGAQSEDGHTPELCVGISTPHSVPCFCGLVMLADGFGSLDTNGQIHYESYPCG